MLRPTQIVPALHDDNGVLAAVLPMTGQPVARLVMGHGAAAAVALDADMPGHRAIVGVGSCRRGSGPSARRPLRGCRMESFLLLVLVLVRVLVLAVCIAICEVRRAWLSRAARAAGRVFEAGPLPDQSEPWRVLSHGVHGLEPAGWLRPGRIGPTRLLALPDEARAVRRMCAEG
jgi:hypothetical protein